jgi:hypothetical protein
MANSRISDLQKKTVLHSTGISDSADDDALFLIAREKSHNETITYEDLKQSITDYSVNTTGVQVVGGEKTFEDNSFFNSSVQILGDLSVEGGLSVRGDILNLKFDDGSGGDADQYLTQLDSNLFTKGNQEVDGDTNLKGELTVLGDASFIDVSVAGDTDLEGKLGVSGDAVLGNFLTTGNAVIEGILNTKGQTILDENLEVKGNIISPTVLGNTLLEGELTVKDQAVLEKDLDIKGLVTISGDASFDQGIETKGTITSTANNDDGKLGSSAFFAKSINPALSLLDEGGTKGVILSAKSGGDFGIATVNEDGSSLLQSVAVTTQGWMGIGTPTPLKNLDVVGDINLSGDIYKDNTLMPIGEWETAGASDIYFNRGKVGIGLTTPTELLDIGGNAKFSGDIIGEGDVYVGGKLLFSNIYLLETDLPSANTYHGMFAHVHDTGKAYYSHAGDWLALVNATSDGKVGIGTSFPDEALHVEGNVKVTGSLVGIDGFTATGAINGDIINANEINIQNDINILTDGILTLHGTNSKIAVPTIDVGDINADQITVTGSDLIVNGIDSKVGIGISSALEAKLHVVGESKFSGLVNFESATPVLDISDTTQPISSTSVSGLINFNTVFSGTKENFGSIGYTNTDNKLKIINTLDGVEFLAAGDIRFADGANVPKLIIDTSTGDTLVKGNLTVEGNLTGGNGVVELNELDIETSIKYKGDDFPAGPRKIGTDFGGEAVASPTDPHAAGSVNDFIFDDEYAYICVVDSDGTDATKKAWKRFPISDW